MSEEWPHEGLAPGGVLYSGGESSRIYHGDFRVKALIPDGWDYYPPEHEDPISYETCMQILALLGQVDCWHYGLRVVHAERAIIEEAKC